MARFTLAEQKRLEELNGERARIKAAAKKRHDVWEGYRIENERRQAAAMALKVEELRLKKVDLDNRIRQVLLSFVSDMVEKKLQIIIDGSFGSEVLQVFKMVDSEGSAPIPIRWVRGKGFEWD